MNPWQLYIHAHRTRGTHRTEGLVEPIAVGLATVKKNLLPLNKIEYQFIGRPARPILEHYVIEILSLKSLYYAFFSFYMSNITKSSRHSRLLY